MKIPTQDEPKAQATGYATGASDMIAPDLGLARGLGEVAAGTQQLAGGVGKLEEEERQRQKKAKAEADAIVNANNAAALQRGIVSRLDGDATQPDVISIDPTQQQTPDNPNAGVGPRTNGFKDTRGLDASAKSAGAMDDLIALRDAVAKNANTPEQRAWFAAHSAEALTDAYRQIEGHVAQQREVAKNDAIKGLAATTLDAIHNDHSSVEAAHEKSWAVEEQIRQLQTSPQDGDAKVAAWRSDVVRTVIQGYLDHGDVTGAEKQFGISKEVLDRNDAGQIRDKILEARRNADKEQAKFQDEVTLDGILKDARGPDSEHFIDESKANALVEQAYPEKRAELRAGMAHRLMLATEEKTQKIKDWRNTAQGAFNQGGLTAIPAAVMSKIHEYDAGFEHQLQEEAYQRLRQARADSRDRRTSDAAERREQAELNHQARNDYLAQPIDVRAAQNIDTDFLGSGADKTGLGDLKRLQAKDVATLKSGNSQGEADFVRDARAAAEGQHYTKQKLADFTAEATLAYQRLVEKNKGRPSTKDATAEISELLLNHTTKPSALPSWAPFSGPSDEPTWQARARDRAAAAKKPAAPPKTIVKYKVSPDKKQRAPVYSDGTVGPIEEAQ